MPNLLYPYLVGFVTTIVVPLIALVAFIVSQRRAVSYARREAKLPLATRWEDLQFQVEDLQSQRDALRDDVLIATNIIERKEEAEQWLRENADRVASMQSAAAELELVKQELTQRQEELRDLEKTKSEFQLDVEKAKFALDQARSLQETALQESERLNKLIEQLSSEATEKTSLIQKLNQQLAEAQRRAEEVTAAVSRAEERLAHLEKMVAQRDAEFKELEKQRSQGQRDVNSLMGESARLDAEVKGLEQQVADLKDVRGGLMKQVSSINPILGDRSQALQELWKPAINIESLPDPRDENLSEERALTDVTQHLRGCGLTFDDRVVKAFHTSLKTARETPLLVLAGISGTGKSLLPQRYCEAMGMHCIVVPVQPRWDNPQDLLGFYNYLEHRYKATELTRALIQMDPIHREWLPEEFDPHITDERVLVVLMDEMNLARVEYYFSEFLSRLENRRLIHDIHKEEGRRLRAEILLDAGLDGDDETNTNNASELRVYVDTNVMFVGTINEDESTLSLSDKVLDRANVMRFGRPMTLGVGRIDTQNQRLSKSYLRKDVWSGWIESARGRDIPDELRLTISQLNDALALVGRPFAFRTAQAMEEYIRQYPVQSVEGRRNALADQIELRVLPKLRGVDTDEDAGSEAVERVRRIAADLNDDALADAIERGRTGFGSRLFVWAGVNRSRE